MDVTAPSDPLDAMDDLRRAGEVQAALNTVERAGKPTIDRVRYTHDAMIDQLIANPWVHQNDLAAYFGYTPAWVSIVINSDMFQAKLAQRRSEIVDPTLRLSLEERFKAVATRSLEVLQEKLSKDASAVPDNLVLRAVELSAKALGVGGNAPPPSLPGDHLAGLADRLLQFQSRARSGDVYDQLQKAEVIEEAVIVREEGGRAEAPHSQAADSAA